MKKLAILFAGILASSAASAAISLEGGKNTVQIADCTILANDIAVILTAGVVGGMQCDTDNNFIAISACHTAGLTKERTVSTQAGADGVLGNEDDCTITETETCTETKSGASFPTATTADGTVISIFPDLTCSATNAETTADAQVAP